MFIKRYKMTLQTKGPVHIGSGKQLKTKEFINLSENIVYFPNLAKMYKIINEKGKDAEFLKFLQEENSEGSVTKWLKSNNFSFLDEDKKPLYGGYVMLNCSNIPRAIEEFINTPGENSVPNFYIPGSSIKGMLRTIIERKLKEDNSIFEEVKKKEFQFWNKLSVSDSQFIKINSFGIYGKVFKEGPVFLQCLNPGVQIEIEITLKSEEMDKLLPRMSPGIDSLPFNLGRLGGNISKSYKDRPGSPPEGNENKNPKRFDLLCQTHKIKGELPMGEKCNNCKILKFGDVKWIMQEIKND